ncbi:FliH/SctL family protein [Chitinimonas koreensis]|uniref:FliH/SctL family protein n=1 Tax=Chitinimonas koreensis TaxID=356302 RepID=UPI0003FE3C45|nr:FliH/SctL family protein [Chitinimonas koreensis]QNM97621.1 hypothetical protein H9L41_04795 [Chitinimonas koreensis]
MSLVRTRYRTDPLDRPWQAEAVVGHEWLASLRSAEDLVAAGQAAADRLIAAARAEAEALQAQARSDAAERLAALERETEAAVWARAAALFDALQAARAATLQALEGELVALGQSLLQALAGQVAEADRVLPVVRALLLAFHDERDATLFLQPDDLARVDAAGAGIGAQPPWTLAADPALARGHCRLESPMGLARVSFDGRVAALAAALAQAGSVPAPPGRESP